MSEINEINENKEINESENKKLDFHENSENFSSGTNVGEILRNERTKQHLDIEAVAQSIKISKRQVEYIENQQWDKLPEKMIILGFVKNYAKFLHLDEKNLIDLLANNQNLEKQIKLEINKGVQFEKASAFKRMTRTFGDTANNKKSFIFVLIAIAVAIVVFLIINMDFANFKNLEETVSDFQNLISNDNKENSTETPNSTNIENIPNSENNLNNSLNNSTIENQNLSQNNSQNSQNLTNTNEIKTNNSSNSSLNPTMFDSSQNQFQSQMQKNDDATNQTKKDNRGYQYPW